MPRFAVYINDTSTYRYEVEADDYEAAEAAGLAIFESDDRESGYSHGHEPEVPEPELLDALPLPVAA
ncbi:hypothetical protein [Kitasatospora sp. NBC_01302]|uniref:hypothetical protein n=1 Tax=Kitasatospora sp. NBC_01302 TaxID=2903575 RepID=UPI002E0FE5DF|nr:hypothetical protein OG294_09245 [Kitasatospora sp. NBC_01302]